MSDDELIDELLLYGMAVTDVDELWVFVLLWCDANDLEPDPYIPLWPDRRKVCPWGEVSEWQGFGGEWPDFLAERWRIEVVVDRGKLEAWLLNNDQPPIPKEESGQ